MAVFISLIRGINVGGNNKVEMQALGDLHLAMGFKNVSTYLNTGNVIFESKSQDPELLAAQLGLEFEKRFGFHAEVIVRTASELKDIFDQNPFLNDPTKEAKWIVVMFLSASPDEQGKQKLMESYTGPEKIFIKDKVLFIYYAEGIGRSKLTNAFIEKTLKVSGTGRNWNSFLKLLEISQR